MRKHSPVPEPISGRGSARGGVPYESRSAREENRLKIKTWSRCNSADAVKPEVDASKTPEERLEETPEERLDEYNDASLVFFTC
ncbi:hypothetical protein LDENG_00076290 [Lucifuga dentata]|nr:hypothetical protein LDENG_00076290 [Lucifuga dentata]